MDKPIAGFKERAELLTEIMRGETSFEILHPDFPDEMIEQQPNINTRLKAADLLARLQGDYFVKTEITIGVDYAAELTRLKQLNEAITESEHKILSLL